MVCTDIAEQEAVLATCTDIVFGNILSMEIGVEIHPTLGEGTKFVGLLGLDNSIYCHLVLD